MLGGTAPPMLELAAYLFLISLLGIGLLTPLAIQLGKQWGVVDVPGPRKIHSEPIPLTGGWCIFAVLSLVLWLHLLIAVVFRDSALAAVLPENLQHFVQVSPRLVKKLALLYGAATLMFALGLWDDMRGVSVKKRLIVQTGVAILLVSMGIRPELPFLPDWVSMIIGVVWIVGITNAFNFLDGLDGLSVGVSLVATGALLAIMAMGHQPIVTFFLACLAGTQFGFLRFNFHPARIFLGSSGSLLLGFLMGVSTLLVSYQIRSWGNWLMPPLAPLFILAIPIYDTTSVVLIRILKKQAIAVGDQSHFHHRLMRLGFSHMQTVIFICLIAFSISISAVLLVAATLKQSLLILLQIVGILSIIVISERVAWRARKAVLERERSMVRSGGPATDSRPDRLESISPPRP